MKTNFSCFYNGKIQSFKLWSTVSFSFLSLFSFSQEKQQDSIKTKQLDEVLVSAVRATEKTPVSYSNFTKKQIAPRNLGQDIPVLMNYMPSVVTTTDAGNGVGYTGIRVRGTDATRVNVTINGIPYNDSESQGTFWVNMPDFASSIESLQLQRGVGTSTNGAGAFGASLNLLTDSFSNKASGEISSSYGSFNTNKNTVKFSTGLMNNHFEIAGRLSTIQSDGYIDRASSDLKSYFLQGSFVGKSTLIKALAFGGTERTYQSWNGIDALTMATNRTYNSVGEKYDNNGLLQGFFNDQVDNYDQNHYQLHWNEVINNNWSTTLAIHYTKGKGFYEEYVDDWKYTNIYFYPDSQFSFLGFDPITVDGNLISSTDYTRRKWLDNDFYGTTFTTNYKTNQIDFIFGGAYNKYDGIHFEQILWAQYPVNSQYGDVYNTKAVVKTDGNVFAKLNYQITNYFSVFGDLQYRNINYKTDLSQNAFVNETFNFFNPKAGFNFDINDKNKLYFSYARANREPNRVDYKEGNPKPEQLNDFELGWRFGSTNLKLNANAYYMNYKDQLILTGELDDVGAPVRRNVDKSYRAGVEIDAFWKISNQWSIAPNITFSKNEIIDFEFVENGISKNLGNKEIAYSPELIIGNALTFSPLTPLKISLYNKFVSDQYLNNIEDRSGKLKDYFVNDFNVTYEIKPKSVFKSITLNLLVNNILNVDYISNGVDYGGGYVYYFPQAGSNYLVGATLKF